MHKSREAIYAQQKALWEKADAERIDLTVQALTKISTLKSNQGTIICPKCGAVNLKQTPKPWEAKPGDTIISQCMLCNHKGADFPIIKKTVVKQFRDNLKKK